MEKLKWILEAEEKRSKSNQGLMECRQKLRFSTVSQRLPEDIIFIILSRLAAKHLVRFNTVCKSWLSLITCDPLFSESHLNHSRSAKLQHTIILTTFSKSNCDKKLPPRLCFLHASTFVTHNQPLGYHAPDDNIFSVDTRDQIYDTLRLNFPLHALKLSVKASCDGLLLLRDQNLELYLYNPVTTAYNHLPHPGDQHTQHSRIFDWTLFYDPSVGSYKVCGFHYYTPNSACDFILLALGEATWSRFKYTYYLKPISPLIFLDKKLHWLTFDNRQLYEWKSLEGPAYNHSNQCFILSMDLTTMTIRKTDAPIHQHKQRHLLSEVKGSLCLTTFSCDQIHVFVLEDDARGGIWTKQRHPDRTFYLKSILRGQLDIFVLEDNARAIWTQKYTATLSSFSNLPSSLKSFLSDGICVAVTRDLDGLDFSGLVKIFVHDEHLLVCYDLKHQKVNIIGPLSKDQILRQVYHFYSGTFVRL